MLKVTLDNAQSGGAQINLLQGNTILAQKRIELDKVKVETSDGIVLLETEGVKCMINFEEVDTLVGRLLTYIDATFTDTIQRKAQKDLVKQTVRGWYDDLQADQFPELDRFGSPKFPINTTGTFELGGTYTGVKNN